MKHIWLFIDKISDLLMMIPAIFGAVGLGIGILIVIIPITITRGFSLWFKLYVAGQGFNEMAFDSSHPFFDINGWSGRSKDVKKFTR